MDKKTTKKQGASLLLIVGLIILGLCLVFAFRGKAGDLFGSCTKRNDRGCREAAISYLNTKYGDGDWKIIASKKDESDSYNGFIKSHNDNGYIFTVTSSYTNQAPFYLYVMYQKYVTSDAFLPTYYSIKYGLDYVSLGDPGHVDTFNELLDRMTSVIDYHYPYDCAGERIHSFEAESYFFPRGVEYSNGLFVKSNVSKKPDLIPNDAKIPELQDVIASIEEYYFSEQDGIASQYYQGGCPRNADGHDEEFFSLVFEQRIGKDERKDYIKNHIAPVDNYLPIELYK